MKYKKSAQRRMNKEPAPIASLQEYTARVLEKPKEEYHQIDYKALEMVGGEILRTINVNFNMGDEMMFQAILKAMVESIPNETLTALVKNDDEELMLEAANKLEEMETLKPTDLYAQLPEKRVPAQYKFYNALFPRRQFVQNYYWEMHGLDQSVESFIKHYEQARCYYADYSRTKWKGNKCIACYQNCVRGTEEVCDYCGSFRRLKLFIKFCQFFKILGDFAIFSYFLPSHVVEYYERYPHFREYFTKSFEFNVIRKYAGYLELINNVVDEGKKKKEKLLMKKRRPPELLLGQLGRIKPEDAYDLDDLDNIGDKTLC